MKPHEIKSADPLDALLREQDGYIPDNGFTARVVAALPARRRRMWLRPVLLGSATMIGGIIALGCMPHPIEAGHQAWTGIRQLQFQPLLALLPILAAFIPLLWSAFEILREEG
jgi:hypothetical protein